MATQVKEKFGTLRFYYSGGNEFINGIVSHAEFLSGCICEKCGTTQNVGTTTGSWITTICKNCYQIIHPERSIKERWKENK